MAGNVRNMPVKNTIRSAAQIAVCAREGAMPEMISVTGSFTEVSDKCLTILAEQAG